MLKVAKIKTDPGMLEYDARRYMEKNTMSKSEIELKEILKELEGIGYRIETLRLKLYQNEFYRKEMADDPKMVEEIDNYLFRDQSDIKFKVVKEINCWLRYEDDD